MERGEDQKLEERDKRRAAMPVVVPEEWNQMTETIIGAAIEVHRHLGPGLLEKVYEEAFDFELRSRGLSVRRQFPVRLKYKGIDLPEQKLDFLVNDLVVVERKAVDAVSDVHLCQLVSYMRAADVPLGLLINFDTVLLTRGVYRRINPEATAAQALLTPSPSAFL